MSSEYIIFEDLDGDQVIADSRIIRPVMMTVSERIMIRDAAFRAQRVFPGPVGEILARELLSWEEFGFRMGGHSLISRLVDQIMREPIVKRDMEGNS